jgi:hypothetical protein
MTTEIQVQVWDRNKCGNVKPVNEIPIIPLLLLDHQRQYRYKIPVQICLHPKKNYTLDYYKDEWQHKMLVHVVNWLLAKKIESVGLKTITLRTKSVLTPFNLCEYCFRNGTN